LHLADGTAAFVTIHPSWLLRIEDEADKERERRNFVADLRQAAKVLAKARAA
jgi:DNA polymerase